MNLGGPELLILVAVAVILFGAGWLPKAARNLGKAKVEFDEVQKQFNETKDQVVAATGVKELESTMRKANKALNTSPQKLIKDAAKSAVKPAATEQSTADDEVEDAEIVEPIATGEEDDDDTNVNVDFT